MVYIIGENNPIVSSGTIMDRINGDKTVFFKNGDTAGLTACKIILGEIQRDPNKDYSDDNVIKILQSLRKMTLKNPYPDYIIIGLVDLYLPGAISDIDVVNRIKSKYTPEDIKSMGNKSMSIIGEMKKFFHPNQINVDCIKEYILSIKEE